MDRPGQCVRQGPCAPAPDRQGQGAQDPEGLGCGVKCEGAPQIRDRGASKAVFTPILFKGRELRKRGCFSF